MSKYRNKNKLTKKYRYKLIETKTNQVSEIVYEPSPISRNTTRNVNGKRFHFLPCNYKPYWFWFFLWSTITLIKKIPKKINTKPIISFLVKFWWKFLIPLAVIIIAILIERGIIDIGI